MSQPAESERRSFPRAKVLYLLLVSLAVFAVPAWAPARALRWYVVPALLALQVVVLLIARVSPRDILRAALRLRWLYAFLIACYVFLPNGTADADDVRWWQPLPNTRAIPLNLTGLETALLMCLQIMTLVLVSAVVRMTGRPNDLVEGLRGFGLPRLLVHSIDTTLALMGGIERRGMGGGRRGGGGGGGGGGRGRGRGEGRGQRNAAEQESESAGRGSVIAQVPEGDERGPAAAPAGGSLPDSPVAHEPAGPSPLAAIGRLLRGDVGFFVETIDRNLDRARRHVEQGEPIEDRMVHDVSVISGVALAMMSLKMLKVLPGLPFLPGWKTIFFYPLYIVAAERTYSRWGATTAGTIMGVLGYLQGDGKYGVLEIFKHAAPGLFTDLAWPAARRFPRSVWFYAFLGLLLAVTRTSTEFAAMWLVGARGEAYLYPAIVVLTNLAAGAISGAVTYFVLGAFRARDDARAAAATPGAGDGRDRSPVECAPAAPEQPASVPSAEEV